MGTVRTKSLSTTPPVVVLLGSTTGTTPSTMTVSDMLTDLQLEPDVDRLSKADVDVVPLDHFEALKFRAQLVDPGRQKRQREAAVCIRNGRLLALRTGRRHRDARHRQRLSIDDAPLDPSGCFLGRKRAGAQQGNPKREHDISESHGCVPLVSVSRWAT